MVKKIQESKAKKAAKVLSKGSGDKKKWSNVKAKEGIKRMVTVDRELFGKIEKEVSKSKAISPSAIAEKFNLNIGCCKKILQHMVTCGVLECKIATSKLKVFGCPAPKPTIEIQTSENKEDLVFDDEKVEMSKVF